VAIEHFERPFTDEERAELAQQIEKIAKYLEKLSAKNRRRQSKHLVQVILFSCFLLPSCVFWILWERQVIWVILATLVLLFCWWEYAASKSVDRRFLEDVQQQHRLAQLQQAQENGTVQGAHLTADALMTCGDDEYFEDFYQVDSHLWVYFYDHVDSPRQTELTLLWHEGRGPWFAAAGGEKLEPLTPNWDENAIGWSDVYLSDGDLFALSLDELLTATPERLESARRGNLFSSPAR
jgi:hypothetical protein